MVTTGEVDETEKSKQGSDRSVEKIVDVQGDCVIEELPKIFDKGDPWY